MKKFISVLLAAVMMLGLAACGTINDAEVAILWDDEGTVKIPDSLINAVERAMYSENVAYKHYGAEGESAKQLKQAEEALEAGSSVLIVKLVDVASAQAIVDLAKAKETPVVFFGCDVDASVVEGYEKCVSVNSDESTIVSVMGKLVGGYVAANLEALDRNSDGKISYLSLAGEATEAYVGAVNDVLKENKAPELIAYEGEEVTAENVGEAIKAYLDESKGEAELILTGSDDDALAVLVALQANGYNKDKLKTHLIPVFTVGADADYKEYVLADKPEGTREDKAVMEYYESVKYLVDLSGVQDDELSEMIYTTANVIGTSKLTGTVIEDYDSVAAVVADVVRNLVTGADILDGLSEELNVDGRTVKVSYASYSN